MRVRIESVGCRLNIGEAESLARALATRGHRIVGPGDAADLLVFNTCAVTHVAARKSRKLIRQWRRAHTDATLVATGCYAELSGAKLEELGVDLVVGNRDKDELPARLEHAGLLRDAEAVPAPDDAPFAPAYGSKSRTRAFVKVQDGCDNRCTFCIVTVARGDSRSRPIAEVVAEIHELVDLGYREAVLSGVHLGSYGHDRGHRHGLEELVGAVLAQTPIERLRLSSLEPWDLRPEFFDLWADPRLLTHLHLPLQSGCDATLQRMARRTDQASYAALLTAARTVVTDLSVTTDIIVGFPGETDAEFAESIAFVERMAFAKLHIFRYSPRSRTAAAAMPGRVAPPVVQERSRRMHELGAGLESRFRRRHFGATMPVLWEDAEERPEGMRWSGLTGNFLRVIADTPQGVDLANTITDTLLVDEIPGAMRGLARLERARAAG